MDNDLKLSEAEIAAGAATVTSLASHFESLKQRANDLIGTVQAQTRGFFTPTEDEQTRHLLVSYWQSRNAMFELVSSLHQLDRYPEPLRPMALTVAYAGALVLVDVARFLRENFHHRPVVRAKLNEPEPHFGIPGGTYELVQKSLTSPVHAWHLYHAVVFVEQHQHELQQQASGRPDFQAVLDIIRRLQHRLNVSVESYVVARTRVRTRSLSNRLTHRLLGRAIYGLQKCVSRLIADRYVHRNHQPGLPPQIESQLQQELQPGDIIVTRKEYAFTNYFLPGYWPHVALYIGTAQELQSMNLDHHENVMPGWQTIETCDPLRPHRVLEALKDGVRVRSLTCPFTSDAIAIIRPRLSREQIATAIGRGFFHNGKPYDFDFDFSRSDRMVCTEVVYRTYEGIGGIEFQLIRRAGRLTLSAEDLLRKAIQQDGFQVHAVYCPSRSDLVCRDHQAVELLNLTVGKS